MKYFLGRVSSKEQNLARQLKVAREKFDIPDENVYCDKITGSSFDRPQYNALKAIVQEGDEVIVKEFDRFGRNKDEMKRELEWFKQKGVIVRILDIPTTLIDFKDQTWVLEMVNNILIEVLGAVAEQERKKTKQRQAEGIAAMLMAGIVNAAGKNGQVKPAIAIVATFLTTFVSGVIFMVIKMAMLGVVGELAAAMLPVVAMTAVFNAILVGALYLPIQKALRLN